MNFGILIMLLFLHQHSSLLMRSVKFDGTLCRSTRRVSLLRGVSFSRESLLSQPAIYSDANDKVKQMKALQMKKKRDALNQILLEGHRQVIDAIDAGLSPTQILVSPRALSGAPLSVKLVESLSKCDSETTQINCVEEQVLDRLADVVHGQGVIAAFHRPKVPSLSSINTIGSSPLLVLLDRLADPGNVGTIIRTSFGLGADAVIVAEGCDVWSPKVTRSAMAMNLQLPVLEVSWTKSPTVEASLKAMSASVLSKLQILLAVPDETAEEYYNIDFTLPTLLVIGSESSGIGSECQALPKSIGTVKRVRIPTARVLESFNAAMAATILLSEAAKQRTQNSR